MLHALDFACGDLPETEDSELLDLNRPTTFLTDVSFPDLPVETAPGFLGLIAANATPAVPISGLTPPASADVPPIFGPTSGPTGGSGGPLPPAKPTTPTTPTTPSTPSGPVFPTTPVSPVPEPASVALMLTGLAGLAGVAKRRSR